MFKFQMAFRHVSERLAYFILYKGTVTSLISLLSQLACVMSPLTTFGYDGFPYG
jgi:hypothetical protein